MNSEMPILDCNQRVANRAETAGTIMSHPATSVISAGLDGVSVAKVIGMIIAFYESPCISRSCRFGVSTRCRECR